MPSENRQIFFLIENSVKNEKDNSDDLSGKMARNLMNRFSISEENQFDISGYHAYDNNCAAFRNKYGKTGKTEGKEISTKEQRKRYREVNKKRKKMLKNLSNALGTLDIMICGMKLFRDFNVSL